MTPVALLELVLALLAAAVLLSVIAGRLGLPPATAMVIGGMALALAPGVPSLDLDPNLIMVLFLPPLLLASAYFTAWRDFRAYLQPILLMSTGAVVFTTLCVGVAAHAIAPALPWAACFALGAIVSPPDAVAAKAVLARVNLPRRLLAVLEGESLVNDASGLVLYRFAVAATLTGGFSALHAASSFAWLTVGGIGLGLLAGLAVDAIFRRLADSHLIVVLSFLAAYGSYLLAEQLGASGVLAVVTCGIVMGWRQHEVLSALTRTEAQAVWGLVVFVLEALVFVLIGLSLRGVLARLGGDAAAIWTFAPMAIAVDRHGACLSVRVDISGRLPPARDRGAPRRTPAAPAACGSHRGELGRHARGREPSGGLGAAGRLSWSRHDPVFDLRRHSGDRARAGLDPGAAHRPSRPRSRAGGDRPTAQRSGCPHGGSGSLPTPA